eukprot:2111948-Alexandrium_andersonii.AAC.1
MDFANNLSVSQAFSMAALAWEAISRMWAELSWHARTANAGSSFRNFTDNNDCAMLPAPSSAMQPTTLRM